MKVRRALSVWRRLPAPPPPPPNPPPGPKNPKLPPSEVDCPNKGEVKLPTGVPRFTWFKMFWKLTDSVRLYFAAAAGPPGTVGASHTARHRRAASRAA